MKKIIGIILTIIVLTSCMNSKKTEKLNVKDSKNRTTQSEFKKIETNNPLKLEYQILDENNQQIEFSKLEKMAEFPGGFDSLTVFIQKNFNFYQGYIGDVEGEVKSTFIVDTLGKVVDIKIIEGLDNHIDKSCYNVIAKLPDWKPAQLSKHKKVKIKFLLPFRFVEEK